MPAKYLAVDLKIEADEDDWGQKLAAVEEARKWLTAAAEKEGFKLQVQLPLMIPQRYSGFSSKAVKDFDVASEAILLAPLNDRSELLQIVRQFRTLTMGFKSSRKAKITMGDLALAVEDPEKVRNELLKRIHDHVEATGNVLFGSSEKTISGVDEVVKVRQAGEKTVEIYLPFRVNYRQKKN
jgi:hypothetical protein